MLIFQFRGRLYLCYVVAVIAIVLAIAGVIRRSLNNQAIMIVQQKRIASALESISKKLEALRHEDGPGPGPGNP